MLTGHRATAAGWVSYAGLYAIGLPLILHAGIGRRWPFRSVSVQRGGNLMTIFSVNGQKVEVEADPRESLLEVLQDRLQLFGTKKGCDHGQCGVCTVHLDGRRVVSCLTLAVQAEGRQVRTIEGVAAADGTLHPVQQAFIDNDAMQCG